MKIVKWIGIVIAVMLVLGFVVGAFLPDSYHVERMQVIKTEPAMIHLLVTDLMRWPEWAPWQETDPSIEMTYGTSRVVSMPIRAGSGSLAMAC